MAERISVIICGYTVRRRDDIRAAISSVVEQRDPPGELLVVIDHNAELRAEVWAFVQAIAAPFPIRVLDSTGPRGLSGARNTGVREAVGHVVAFLDDDAAASPDWIGQLAGGYCDAGVRGVGGRALPRWPDSGRPRWFPTEFDWVIGCSHPGQPSRPGPVRNFIGANMSLRRSDVLAAGGFHTELGRIGRTPLGCEETELCIAIAQRIPDARFHFDPEAIVQHRVSDDRVSPRYFLRRCRAEGVSKAAVARLVGSGDALSSERDYVRKVLPSGIWVRLSAILGNTVGKEADSDDRWSLVMQIAMIGSGLVATGTGYLRGQLVSAHGRQFETAGIGRGRRSGTRVSDGGSAGPGARRPESHP